MEEYKRVSVWLFWIVVFILLTAFVRGGIESFITATIWVMAALGAPISGLYVAEYLHKKRHNGWVIGISAFAMFGFIAISVYEMGKTVKSIDWRVQEVHSTELQ